jgi:glyoxylase-like metal-dependent hydrolase (beta-lactamase superfamily II)
MPDGPMADAAARLPAGVTVFERGWLSSNNVLIVGVESAALVDSGYATHAAQTMELVRRALGDRSLDELVNTHLHSDHCGGNAALQGAYPELRTWIPPGLAPYVANWDPVALTYVPTGQQCPRFSFDRVLPVGERLRLGDDWWEVHAAPGHDPNSVVLFEPRTRTLLSADALWQNGFGVVFQELEGERAFDEVSATLDLIESLRPAVVVPGHGSVFADVDAAIERARSRLAAYLANPARHAAHAAKVLLKFKLLEIQAVRLDDFLVWAENVPYFQLVHHRWSAGTSIREWIESLLQDLVAARAAQRSGDFIVNA